MTQQQRSTLGTYFTIANFVVLISFVWYQAQWQKNVENKIEKFEKHTEDVISHIPIEKRIELEIKVNNVLYSLKEIEKKIDKIK